MEPGSFLTAETKTEKGNAARERPWQCLEEAGLEAEWEATLTGEMLLPFHHAGNGLHSEFKR